jgi:hypothetical protein
MDDVRSRIVIEIHLLDLFTGTPHSSAAKSTLFVTDAMPHTGRCIISMEIVGDILALLVAYPHGDETPDEIYIFDWKKGELVMVRQHLSFPPYP